MQTSLAKNSAIFTTLLARYGKLHYLSKHIQRLQSSAGFDWPVFSENNLREMIGEVLQQRFLTDKIARVRIIHSSDGIAVDAEKYFAPFESFILTPHRIATPLGALKRWPFVNLGIPENGDLLLIEQSTGRIFEGNKTTFFVKIDGTLVTPPLDGSILPGIARSNVVNICKRLHIPLVERALYFDEIRGKEIYVSNSLMGLRRAKLS